MFTATSSVGLERIIMQVITNPEYPKKLSFSSEYELINKISSVDGAKIEPRKTKAERDELVA